MDTSLLLKIVGVGFTVAVAGQMLSRSGRDEQATLLSLAGMITVFLMLSGELSELFSTLSEIFGL